jgi:hypothetical protein
VRFSQHLSLNSSIEQHPAFHPSHKTTPFVINALANLPEVDRRKINAIHITSRQTSQSRQTNQPPFNRQSLIPYAISAEAQTR